jgi:hypothetical protein
MCFFYGTNTNKKSQLDNGDKHSNNYQTFHVNIAPHRSDATVTQGYGWAISGASGHTYGTMISFPKVKRD